MKNKTRDALLKIMKIEPDNIGAKKSLKLSRINLNSHKRQVYLINSIALLMLDSRDKRS